MHIRVIAPSLSLGRKEEQQVKDVQSHLESLGFTISYSEHAFEIDELGSSPVSSRIQDLHTAFQDASVDIILCASGGFNANQLLPHIDWDIIKNNPKKFCGYSDITALNAAIYAKAGIKTYNGPNFTNFAREDINGYRDEYFKKCILSDQSFEIFPSQKFQDWNVTDADNKEFQLENPGWWILNEGQAEGTIIGENLCTLNLLQGTEFMPSLKNAILFIEDDYESKDGNFTRDLQSLLMQPDAHTIKGLILGRFQVQSKIGKEKLRYILSTFPQLKNIPIIANLDFGHTSPRLTIPVGAKAKITASSPKATIEIDNI